MSNDTQQHPVTHNLNGAPLCESITIANTKRGVLINEGTRNERFEINDPVEYTQNIVVRFVNPAEGFEVPLSIEASRISDWKQQKSGKLNTADGCYSTKMDSITYFEAKDDKDECFKVTYRPPLTPVTW